MLNVAVTCTMGMSLYRSHYQRQRHLCSMR